MEVKNKLTRLVGNGKLTVKKYSPEILLAAGIISGAAALVCAVKETLKCEEVLDNHTKKMDEIKGALTLAESEEVEYTEDDAKKDKTKVYLQTGLEFAKLYAPTVILAGVSLTCILSSHGIMRKRNVALAATLATVRTAFDEYRGRVVRDLGKEMDNHFLYDTVEKTIEHEETDEKGKKKVTKEVYSMPTVASAYSRFFDEGSKNWEKDGSANYMFIRAQMKHLQNKLIANGHLFLNDVYQALGLPITVAGQSAGWIYDFNDRDNTLIYFDGFDIDGNELMLSSNVRALMNGYERSVLLNFMNIKDDILTDLPRVDGSVEAI